MRKVFEYQFPDSGVTVKVRKVSPFIAVQARAAMASDPTNPKPQPPEIIIEEEGPLKGTTEVNRADPDYIDALRRWERGINEKVLEMQIKHGIVEICDPDWEKEVKEFRKEMRGYGITDLPASDIYVYVIYLAAITPAGLSEFSNFLASRTVPDQEVVQAALDQFRPDA